MNVLSALNNTNLVEQTGLPARDALANEERASYFTKHDYTPVQTTQHSELLASQRRSSEVYSNQDKVIAGFWLITAAIDVALPRGANIHKLLRGTGIFEDAISHDLMISTNQYTALLTNVHAQTKGNDVGFLIGSALATTWKTSPLSTLSSLENTGDIIHYLMSEQRFRWCMAPLVYARQYELNEHILWVPEVNTFSEKLKTFALEILFSCLFSLLKQITGKRVPVTFTFGANRPRNIADFETHLGLKVFFNQPVTGIWLDKRCIANASKSSIRQLKASTSEQILNVQTAGECGRAHEPNYTDNPKREMNSVLMLRQVMLLPDFVRNSVFSNVNCGLADIADYLGVSTATLKRKLKEHGTNYRLLSEEVMRNKAIVLLSLKKLTNEQACAHMAMSDLPNFRRTIKRLTGKTPSELRAISNY